MSADNLTRDTGPCREALNKGGIPAHWRFHLESHSWAARRHEDESLNHRRELLHRQSGAAKTYHVRKRRGFYTEARPAGQEKRRNVLDRSRLKLRSRGLGLSSKGIYLATP